MKTKQMPGKAITRKRRPERCDPRAPCGTWAIAPTLSALVRCASVVLPAPSICLVPFAQSARGLVFRFSLSAFFLLCFSLLLHASGDPSLYPDGREKVDLRPAERNPFAQQVVPEAAPANPQEGATEEARLRRILRAMKIGGVSGAPGDRRVLLGSLILKPGEILPQILNNQFEALRVLSVDDAAVVLAFVERDSAISARQIVLPYAIKPGVSQVMIGEAFEELTKVGPSGKIAAPPLTIQGVDDLLKGSREADLRNIADRDVQMMGVITNAENAKKGK